MAGWAQYLPDPVGRPWPSIGRPHVHDIRPNPDRWMSARARCSRPFQEELAIQSVVTALPDDQVKRPPDSYASGLRFRPSCHHSSPDRHRGRQPRGCTPATPPGMWVRTGRFKKLSSAESGKAQLLPDPRRLCQPVVALPARQVAAQLLHDLRALQSLARSPCRAVPCIRRRAPMLGAPKKTPGHPEMCRAFARVERGKDGPGAVYPAGVSTRPAAAWRRPPSRSRRRWHHPRS